MIGASVIENLYVLKYIQAETSADNKKRLQQRSPHTPGCHLGGKPGIPPNSKDQPPPPPLLPPSRPENVSFP